MGGAGVKERARRGIGDVHDRGGTATGRGPEKRRGKSVRRGEAADPGNVSEDAREYSALSEECDSTGSGEGVKLIVEWVTIVNACEGANDTDQRVTAGTKSLYHRWEEIGAGASALIRRSSGDHVGIEKRCVCIQIDFS